MFVPEQLYIGAHVSVSVKYVSQFSCLLSLLLLYTTR